MPPISSSVVANAEWTPGDPKAGTQSVLTIQFRSGAVYEYDNVPREVYEGLLDSHEGEGYFSHNIRNRYLYRKVS